MLVDQNGHVCLMNFVLNETPMALQLDQWCSNGCVLSRILYENQVAYFYRCILRYIMKAVIIYDMGVYQYNYTF